MREECRADAGLAGLAEVLKVSRLASSRMSSAGRSVAQRSADVEAGTSQSRPVESHPAPGIDNGQTAMIALVRRAAGPTVINSSSTKG